MNKKCTKCGKELPATKEYFNKKSGGKYGLKSVCNDCLRKYRFTNKELIAERNKIYYSNNSIKIIDKVITNHKHLMGELISHYGGCCAVCGETNLSFLCIDHINNDGAEHRKKVGCGFAFYWWLKRNGFPSGFQVLCWNHNWLKHLEYRSGINLNTKKALRNRKTLLKLKLGVISHYGGKCTCCGEDNPDLLTIDHTGGGGCKHRKEIGSNYKLYRWIRDNGYQNEFRILCFNCNSGRYVNGGVCPHEFSNLRVYKRA